MARHLIFKAADGTLLTTIPQDMMALRTGLAITAALENAPAGSLWLARSGAENGRVYLSLGGQLKNPAKAAAQYLATPTTTYASTGSPGIAGYQQRADASKSAAEQAQSRSRFLGWWITKNVLAGQGPER